MKWTPWISANVEEESLVLASPEDIASMKLPAITNRGTKKDFIDLYELLDHFSLEQMFGFYREKYTDAIPFMTLKSLTWFEDAEGLLRANGMTVNEMKARKMGIGLICVLGPLI